MSIYKPNGALLYKSENFWLEVCHYAETTQLTMQVLTPWVSTCEYPQTYSIIKRNLPSALDGECFNDKHLPFRDEVRDTELGHLFEHLLIEYLCLEKINTGISKALYSGKTRWNWQRDEFGLFELSVSAGLGEASSFTAAMSQAILLTEKILHGSLEVVSVESHYV